MIYLRWSSMLRRQVFVYQYLIFHLSVLGIANPEELGSWRVLIY
jgi:hypothetical protein